jgi:adenylate cyclase
VGEKADAVEQARALLKQAEYQKVLDLLVPWLAEHEGDASGWETLGAAYFGMRLFEGAEEAAQRVLRLQPDSARAWSNLGTMLRKLGRYEQARQAQVRAIELDPGYDRARLELGRVHEAIEREQEPPPEPFDELG